MEESSIKLKIIDLILKMETDPFEVLLILGISGSGKTTSVKEILNHLKKMNCRFHLLGATGVAARILSNKTNEHATTIHSKIYQFNTQLSTDGESVFDVINNETEEMQYVVLDEGSMVGDQNHSISNLIYGSGRLLTDLIQSFGVSKNGNSKLIIIGDPYQLSPVFEEFCPALSKSYIEQKFNLRVEEITLTENYRQRAAPEILNFAKQFLNKEI